MILYSLFFYVWNEICFEIYNVVKVSTQYGLFVIKACEIMVWSFEDLLELINIQSKEKKLPLWKELLMIKREIFKMTTNSVY